jgi:hypothetical protein
MSPNTVTYVPGLYNKGGHDDLLLISVSPNPL